MKYHTLDLVYACPVNIILGRMWRSCGCATRSDTSTFTPTWPCRPTAFNGNADDLKNVGNGGFYYVRSTNRTVEVLNRWLEASSRFPSAHDQGGLTEIKAELAAGDLQIKFVADVGGHAPTDARRR